ncbi:MAG: hypothetical protein AAF799_03225 [Myxococcota bacterium]
MTNAAPNRRGLSRLHRSLLRGVMAVFMVLGLWLGSASTASAIEGEPTGWRVEQATAVKRIGRFELHYEPELEGEAEFLAKGAPYWWSEIETELDGDLDDTLKVIFVDHAGQVAQATGMPHWAAGVANGRRGEILIARHGPDGSPTNLEELLRHEMAHVALHRATNGAPLPRWFNEGMAESFEGTLSLQRTQTLASAVFGPGVPDLEHLEENFQGADGPEAAVAYAAARDLVDFMRSYQPKRIIDPLDGKVHDEGTTGAMRMRQVFTEMRNGKSFEVAVIRAYGVGLDEMVLEWRQGLPGRFVWYPLMASGGLPFILVAPLVLVAWVRRRRAVQRGYDRLDREERYLMAMRSTVAADAHAY